jgi:autotransporter-associated beta strand protein
MITRSSSILILAGVLVMGISQFAAAQDPTPSPTPDPSATPIDAQYTWKNTGTDFNTTGNWTPNSGPPAAGDVAAFNAAAVAQPNLSTSDTISGLYFTGTGTSGYDLTRSGITQTLTLNGFATTIAANGEKSDSTAVAIGAENTSGTNTIDVPIILAPSSGSTSTIFQAAGGTLVINGAISGTASIAKTGTGTLALTGANTYTGATTVSAGILNIQNATALGTTASGTTVSSGATLQLQGGITVGAEALTISGTGASGQNGALVNVSGTNNYGGLLTLGAATTISSDDSGTLNLTNPGTITGATFGLTVTGSGSGSISSIIGTTSGTLTKSGTGSWTLTGANTYTGATTVNAGKLFINGNQTAATGTTTVNGSGTVLGGTGTIGGSVSMASSGAILEGGTGSTGQTLTIKGSLTQVTGSIIELALGPALTHSTLALTNAGSSSFYSTQKVSFIDLGATAGTYQDIITGVTSNPGSLSGWTITNTEFQGSFSWDSSDNGIDLTLTQVPEPGTWCAAALAFGAVLLSQKRRLSRVLARA